MLEYRYDTQLLIEGENLSEDAIHQYITDHIPGDCLLAVGDENLIKIHFHTNIPWKVLSIAPGWERSSILWWKIWTGRSGA